MDSIDPIKSRAETPPKDYKGPSYSSLPEEVLVQIFDLLSPQETPHAHLVDRKWNRILRGSSPWGEYYFRIASCFYPKVDPESRPAMRAFAEGLKPKSVDLSGFLLTDELVDLVSSLQTVETLKLAYVTDLTPERLKRLTYLPKLVEIDISSNSLQEDHFKVLSEAVKDERLQGLRALNLSKTHPTLPNLKLISNLLGSLERLHLSGNEQIVEIVKDLKKLKVLVFSKAKLNNAALLLIAEQLTELRSLEVTDNRISPENMRQIGEKFRKLESLDISWNEIYDQGLKDLAAGLRNNPNFSRLIINLVSISTEGAKAVGGSLHNLRELDIQFNPIGDEGVIAIAKGCKELQVLNISACHCASEGALAIAEKLSELRSLDIHMNADVEDAAGREMATHLVKLEKLKMGSTRIGGETLEAISRHLIHLKQLDLSDVRLFDFELRPLVIHLKNLESLSLSISFPADAAVAQVVEHLPRLKALSIDSGCLTDVGAKCIADGLGDLEDLSIIDNRMSDAALIEIVKKHRKLKSLSVPIHSSKGLGDFLELLSSLPWLERLQIVMRRSLGKFSGEIVKAKLGRTLGNLSYTFLP